MPQESKTDEELVEKVAEAIYNTDDLDFKWERARQLSLAEGWRRRARAALAVVRANDQAKKPEAQ